MAENEIFDQLAGEMARDDSNRIDWEQLRKQPEIWKRLATPTGKYGHMESVFPGDKDPFRDGPEQAVERLKSLADDGLLYLRDSGTNEFRKISKVGEDYLMDGGISHTEEPPYDPILGNLLRLADNYFKGIFGVNWFTDMADRYRAYRTMHAAMNEEVMTGVLEDVRRETEQSQRTDGQPPDAQKQSEGKQAQGLAAEPEKVSMQQPNSGAVEKKKTLQEKLEEESAAWKGSQDWKKRSGEALFHSEGGLKADYEKAVADQTDEEYLIGTVGGLLGGSTAANRDQQIKNQLLDGLLNAGGRVEAAHEELIREGIRVYQEAMRDYSGEKGGINKEPMEKLLHNAVVELAKGASGAERLSERHRNIGVYVEAITKYVADQGMENRYTEEEERIVRGAAEMGKIATKGATARQALGKMENIDLKNPETQQYLADYLTMLSVDAGLKFGGKEKDGLAPIQHTLGAAADAEKMAGLTRENAKFKELLAAPDGAEQVRALLEEPGGMKAMNLGRQLLGQSSLTLATRMSAAVPEPQPQIKAENKLEQQPQIPEIRPPEPVLQGPQGH